MFPKRRFALCRQRAPVLWLCRRKMNILLFSFNNKKKQSRIFLSFPSTTTCKQFAAACLQIKATESHYIIIIINNIKCCAADLKQKKAFYCLSFHFYLIRWTNDWPEKLCSRVSVAPHLSARLNLFTFDLIFSSIAEAPVNQATITHLDKVSIYGHDKHRADQILIQTWRVLVTINVKERDCSR